MGSFDTAAWVCLYRPYGEQTCRSFLVLFCKPEKKILTEKGLSLFHLTRSFGAICLRYRPTLLLWHNRTGLSVTALLSLNILHRHLEFFSDLNIKINFWNILEKNSKWSLPHTSPWEHLHRWTAGLAYTPSSAPENIFVEETVGFKIGKMSTEVWSPVCTLVLEHCCTADGEPATQHY